MDKFQNRTLYFGDNLDILREKIPDESFNLVYLDPPFNSKRDYNILFKEGLQESEAQLRVFEDSWHWTKEAENTFNELIGAKRSKTKITQNIINLITALEKIVGRNDVLAYLVMMTIRLIELHRVLKPTGSIYLHCDSTASHYLKIIMDVIFGKQNFQNEIIWRYRRWPAKAKCFQRMHDVILFYIKDNNKKHVFNIYYEPLAESTLKADKGLKIKNIILPDGRRIRGEKTGEESLGVPQSDVFDISIISPTAKERLGYPTQKPEALLERIVKASSNKGDWILDPFCGCGTTVAVAERLSRNWVGIDITTLAINLIKRRLFHQFNLGRKQIFADGLPKDVVGAKTLFKKNPFEFEYWVCDLVGAMPAQSKTKENMRGADKGIDGIINVLKETRGKKHVFGQILVQVKGGGVQRKDIAILKGDVDREKALGGIFITLEKPTRPMKEEVVKSGTFKLEFGLAEYPKIQILTIEELLGGKEPKIPTAFKKSYYKEAKADDTDYTDTQNNLNI